MCHGLSLGKLNMKTKTSKEQELGSICYIIKRTIKIWNFDIVRGLVFLTFNIYFDIVFLVNLGHI